MDIKTQIQFLMSYIIFIMNNEQQTLKKCRKILQFFDKQKLKPKNSPSKSKKSTIFKNNLEGSTKQQTYDSNFTPMRQLTQNFRKNKSKKSKQNLCMNSSMNSLYSSKNPSNSKLSNAIPCKSSVQNSIKKCIINSTNQKQMRLNHESIKNKSFIKPTQILCQHNISVKQSPKVYNSIKKQNQKDYIVLNIRNSVQLCKKKNQKKEQSHLNKIMNIPMRKPKVQSYLKTHGFQSQQTEFSKYKWQQLQLRLMNSLRQDSNKRTSGKQSLMDTRYLQKYGSKLNRNQQCSYKSTLNNSQKFLKEMTNSIKQQIAQKLQKQVNLLNQSEQQQYNILSKRQNQKQSQIFQKVINLNHKVIGHEQTDFPFKISQQLIQQSKQLQDQDPQHEKSKVNRSISILNCIQDMKNESTLDIIQSQVYSSLAISKNQLKTQPLKEVNKLSVNARNLPEMQNKENLRHNKNEIIQNEYRTDQLIKTKFKHQRERSKTPQPQLNYTFNLKQHYPTQKGDHNMEHLKRISFQSFLNSNGSINQDFIQQHSRNASKQYNKKRNQNNFFNKQSLKKCDKQKCTNLAHNKTPKMRSSIYDQLSFSELLNLQMKKIEDQKKRIRVHRQLKVVNC